MKKCLCAAIAASMLLTLMQASFMTANAEEKVIYTDDFKEMYDAGYRQGQGQGAETNMLGTQWWYNHNAARTQLWSDTEGNYVTVAGTGSAQIWYKEAYIQRADKTYDLTAPFTASVSFKMRDGIDYDMYPILFHVDADTNPFNRIMTLYVSSDGGLYAVDCDTSAIDITSTDKATIKRNKICDITADNWYDITLDVNVDGDENTFDTYMYTVSDGTNTYKNSTPYTFGITLANNGMNPDWDFTKISQVQYGRVYAQEKGVKLKNIKLAMKGLEIVSTSIADGETDVSTSTKEYVINFSRDMDASTFDGIAIKNKYGNVAAKITPSSGTSKSCTITFNAGLLSNTEYTIEVPDTVKSVDGASVDAATYTFKTVDNSQPYVALTDEFADIYEAGKNYGYVSNVGNKYKYNGSVTTSILSYDEDLGLYKATQTGKDTVNDGSNMNYLKRVKSDYDLAGNIETTLKFKTNNVTDMTLPVVFFVDGKEENQYIYIETIYIKDGKIYAQNCSVSGLDITQPTACKKVPVEICDAKADTWYDITIKANIDGSDETFDTYSYKVSDGENTYTGDDLTFGIVYGNNGNNPKWNFTKISGFWYAVAHTQSTMEVAAIKTTVIPNPTFSTSIADGETNVPVNTAIDVIFDRNMNASTFCNIKLYQGNIEIPIGVTPYSGTSEVCNITVPNPLAYNREFKLVIPSTVVDENGAGVLRTEIYFSTEQIPSIFDINNITVNNGEALSLTAGATVTVSADFTNKESAEAGTQNGVLLAGIFNSDGAMIAVTYQTKEIAQGATQNISASFTVPNTVKEGAYVKVFCWDNLTNMTPIADSVSVSE